LVFFCGLDAQDAGVASWTGEVAVAEGAEEFGEVDVGVLCRERNGVRKGGGGVFGLVLVWDNVRRVWLALRFGSLVCSFWPW
jgi:hypothetical protein